MPDLQTIDLDYNPTAEDGGETLLWATLEDSLRKWRRAPDITLPVMPIDRVRPAPEMGDPSGPSGRWREWSKYQLGTARIGPCRVYPPNARERSRVLRRPVH